MWHHCMGSILMILLGIYVAYGAIHLGVGAFNKPGGGFIFMLAAVILEILAVVDLATTILARKRKNTAKNTVWSDLRWGKVILTLASVGIYALVLEIIGFGISTFLLLFFLFKIVEPVKWRDAILGSVLTVAVVYAVFGLWLKVPFPTGILFE
jgi:putative tricarboxylic transport membrane protein